MLRTSFNPSCVHASLGNDAARDFRLGRSFGGLVIEHGRARRVARQSAFAEARTQLSSTMGAHGFVGGEMISMGLGMSSGDLIGVHVKNLVA
jgi:hypothetical protein